MVKIIKAAPACFG